MWTLKCVTISVRGLLSVPPVFLPNTPVLTSPEFKKMVEFQLSSGYDGMMIIQKILSLSIVPLTHQ